MNQPVDVRHREQRANDLAVLAQAIQSAGGTLNSEAGREADLVFGWGSETYVVALKSSQLNRLEHLEGLLASAFLMARKQGSELGAHPLPMLAVERLTNRTLAALQEYVGEVAQGSNWGVIDRRGRRYFQGAQFDRLNSEGEHRPRAERGHDNSLELFTDLGQWMSKVLLARRIPESMLAAPRERPRNARDLARIADVSAPTAARWAACMKREGFLEEGIDGLQIVRQREFLHRWQRSVRNRREVPARFALPSKNASEQLGFVVGRYAMNAIAEFDPDNLSPYPSAVHWKPGPRACLGLFEASSALGAAFVHGAPSHLLLDMISESVLKSFDLVPARRGERVDVVVIQPRFRESAFRGVVMTQRRDLSKVPVSDVIQTWLDVANHPARGRENADELERRFLAPWLWNNP